MKTIIMIMALCIMAATPLLAGKADVVAAEVTRTAQGIYRFDVTVRHADTGWSHYADRFDILAPDGTVLGTRVLYHPHVDEQPFTRSLSGVAIPEGIRKVTVRAHDLVHGTGGSVVTVTLP